MEENYFGKQITLEREKEGMSIAELSLKSGLDEKEIIEIENGTKFPNMRHIFSVSKALNKHQGYFLKKFVI